MNIKLKNFKKLYSSIIDRHLVGNLIKYNFFLFFQLKFLMYTIGKVKNIVNVYYQIDEI